MFLVFAYTELPFIIQVRKKSVSSRPYNYIAIILSVISRALETAFCRSTAAEQEFPGGVTHILLFLYRRERNWLFTLKPFFVGL